MLSSVHCYVIELLFLKDNSLHHPPDYIGHDELKDIINYVTRFCYYVLDAIVHLGVTFVYHIHEIALS
jgi:hypothetical protein